jgi:hypothetical protein
MTPDGLAMGESFVTEDDGGGRPVRRHLPVIADVVPVVADVGSRGRPKRVGKRPMTLSMRRQSKRELEELRAKYPGPKTQLPATRGECEGHEGPCPLVSCRWNIYLDVNPRNGNIKLNFPDKEVWELPATCALDVADRDGVTLEELGALVNLTRERARQIVDRGLASLAADTSPAAVALADYLDAETPGPGGNLRVRIVAIRHTPDALPRSYR